MLQPLSKEKPQAFSFRKVSCNYLLIFLILRHFSSEKLKSINLNCKNLVEDEIAPIKRKDARSIQNPFKKYSIPDEITEQIFSNLKKKDLLSAMLVCHRFYGIGHKSRNWIITDAQDRPISEISLIALSQRKIKVLRLAGAKVRILFYFL